MISKALSILVLTGLIQSQGFAFGNIICNPVRDHHVNLDIEIGISQDAPATIQYNSVFIDVVRKNQSTEVKVPPMKLNYDNLVLSTYKHDVSAGEFFMQFNGTEKNLTVGQETFAKISLKQNLTMKIKFDEKANLYLGTYEVTTKMKSTDPLEDYEENSTIFGDLKCDISNE